MMPTVKVPLVTRGSVPLTMTDSLRRLQEPAACCVQKLLQFASDEGCASVGCPSACSQHDSLQPEDHRTLHDEIDGGGNPLGYDESDDLNAELAQASSSEQGEQQAEQANL
jgi:hypothetical protein